MQLQDLKLFACRDEGARVTLLGAALDTLIGVAKFAAGALVNSSALVADGLHSLSDAASDLVVVAAHNLSSRAPTANYAYGYQRAETLGVLFIGVLLLAFALGLAYHSVATLAGAAPAAQPGAIAISLALVCLLLKEAYYRLSLAVGHRLGSDLLIANAHHSRTDVYTSLLVVTGLVAVEYGWYWLDPLMALGIAVLVCRVALGFLRSALSELMEANLPDRERGQVLRCLAGVEGVRGCHGLRGRRVGRAFVLECHLEVDARCSVSEGHQIGARATAAVLSQVAGVRELLVHVDPVGQAGGHGAPLPLPQRAQVMATFGALGAASGLAIDATQSRLHYADGGIRVELYCRGGPPPSRERADALQRQLQALVDASDWLIGVELLYALPALQPATADILYLNRSRQVAG